MTAEEIAEKEELELLRAYQNVFLGSAEGQIVFWDLINNCHVFKAFKTQNAGAYLLEGKRELGLYLMNMVEFSTRHGGPDPAGMERIRQSLERTAKAKITREKEDQGSGG